MKYEAMPATQLPPSARAAMETLYRRYNRRCFVHPDPLEAVYWYGDPGDREVAGLVASALAFGRVAHILASVKRVLAALGPHPRRFLERARAPALWRRFAGFCHRFTGCCELVGLLLGARAAIAEFGSLGACFHDGLRAHDETVVEALGCFVRRLCMGGAGRGNFLLPDPLRRSACKRLHLFLRWMVRRDAVDAGVWPPTARAKLVVPMDTHMHRICLALGLTQRRQANLAAALEATAGFRHIAPNDPVRYDFALTRLGMRGRAEVDAFVAGLCRGARACGRAGRSER